VPLTALDAEVCWAISALGVSRDALPNSMLQMARRHCGVAALLCPTAAVRFAQRIAQQGLGTTWDWTESPEKRKPVVVLDYGKGGKSWDYLTPF